MLIAQLSDLHCRPLGLASNRVVETNMFAERAFAAVMRRHPLPDLVLLTGDLTDNGLDDEYALVSDLIARHVRVPVFTIPGNHDQRERMIEKLGGVRHEDGFIQYVIEDLPVRIVMLDTVVPGAAHGILCKRRLEWLDDTLAAAPRATTLIAMHHPPFPTGIVHMDRICLHEREAFGAVLARHRQVERIICGHLHRPITAQFGHTTVSVAPSVAHQVEFDLRPDSPPLFRMEPPAYLLHHWAPDFGFVTHQVYVEDHPGPYPFIF